MHALPNHMKWLQKLPHHNVYICGTKDGLQQFTFHRSFGKWMIRLNGLIDGRLVSFTIKKNLHSVNECILHLHGVKL